MRIHVYTYLVNNYWYIIIIMSTSIVLVIPLPDDGDLIVQ